MLAGWLLRVLNSRVSKSRDSKKGNKSQVSWLNPGNLWGSKLGDVATFNLESIGVFSKFLNLGFPPGWPAALPCGRT